MADAGLVERLAALPPLAAIPRAELEWLVAHGQLETFDAGELVSRKGEPITQVWIMLSGHMAITVDRGAGPRRVLEWRSGDVSGLVHRRVPVGVRRSQAVDEQHPQPAAPLSITDSAAFAFSEAVRVRAA